MAGDDDVLMLADRLAATAERILVDLDLMARLESVGRPILVGSAAARLMVRPDIDFDVACPVTPDTPAIFACAQSLFDHPRVKRVNLVDELGPFQTMAGPDSAGIYCGLRYHEDGTLAGSIWRIDIWFLLEDATRPEVVLRDRLLAASDDERHAILRIKRDLIDAGRYGNELHGIDVYLAVLDRGVRSVSEFDDVRGV
jgi:hypothetical protein